MTDAFNTAPGKDRHSLAVDYEESFHDDGKSSGGLSYAECYYQGLEILKESGIILELSIGGTFAYHHVYTTKPPYPIKGVKYPRDFEVLMPLHTTGDLQWLTDNVNSMPEGGIKDFWKPLSQPDPQKRKPLYQVALQLLQAESNRGIIASHQPTLSGITLNGANGARAWVPPVEWFAPSLRQLTFRDIFSIFPTIETQVLQLAIGRAAVGVNNSQTVEGTVIKHTSRMGVVVLGEDPGMGKSRIFETWISAIQRCGYRVATFGKISSRFNLGNVLTADVAYKDDTTLDTLKSIFTSETTKTMITGGRAKVEDKGKDAVEVQCSAVLIACTNEINPRIAYDLDPGVVDRIKICSTFYKDELKAVRMGGMAKDSPDLKYPQHLDWLCESLDVDASAIMLWATRLAVDEFLKVTSTVMPDGSNPLEIRVKNLTLDLRKTIHKDATKHILGGIWFSYMLRHCKNAKPVPIKAIDRFGWQNAIADFAYLRGDSLMSTVRQFILDDWEDLGRPANHPWLGFESIMPTSLTTALHRAYRAIALNGGNIEQLSLSDYLKVIFGSILLADGFSVSSDIVWLNSSWQHILASTDEFYASVRRIVERLEAKQANDPEVWDNIIEKLHQIPRAPEEDLDQDGLPKKTRLID